MSLVHQHPDKASQETLTCLCSYSDFFSCCVFLGCVMGSVCNISGVKTIAQIYIPDPRCKVPAGRTPEAK